LLAKRPCVIARSEATKQSTLFRLRCCSCFSHRACWRAAGLPRRRFAMTGVVAVGEIR
jgi:hypothetical protein